MNVKKLPFEGKTLVSIEKIDDYLIFNTTDGEGYKMYHSQDCCESVNIDDVNGDFDDLLGAPLLVAEEVSNEAFVKNFADSFSSEDEIGCKTNKDGEWEPESYTWTFYRLSTIKGDVDIRWYGESNGFYSESVDVILIGGEYDY